MDISRLRLRGKRLAFLSACDTAHVSNHLADEAIHLGSAFLLAGYPHVVATLWQVNDSRSPRLAKAVYQPLTASEPARRDRIATNLHLAILQLRKFKPDDPRAWAAHIHMGP